MDPNRREIKVFNPETKEDSPKFCTKCGRKFSDKQSLLTHLATSLNCEVLGYCSTFSLDYEKDKILPAVINKKTKYS